MVESDDGRHVLGTRPDIRTEEDVERFVYRNYTLMRKDPLLGEVFPAVPGHDWEAHLPRMVLFWRSVLWADGGYHGDLVAIHSGVAGHHPLDARHFARWADLFDQAIDELFEGGNADRMKGQARALACQLFERMQTRRSIRPPGIVTSQPAPSDPQDLTP